MVMTSRTGTFCDWDDDIADIMREGEAKELAMFIEARGTASFPDRSALAAEVPTPALIDVAFGMEGTPDS